MAAATTSQIPSKAIVVTDRCFIRPIEESDAPSMAAAAGHEDISRYMRNTFPYPYTLDHAKFFINMVIEKKPTTNFAICLPDGTYAGGIGLIPGQDVNFRTWEIGYWVGKDFWGKGVTTSAVKGFTKWAFNTFPEIIRLEAGVYEGNSASMKVLERAGFLKEGVKRKAAFKYGVALDVSLYSLLREDIENSA